MKKVAILTLPLHFNYGGILQAYALQTTIRRMGYDVEHIEVGYKPSAKEEWLLFCKRLVGRFFRGDKTELLHERNHRKKDEHVGQRIYSFIKKNIRIRHFQQFCDIKESDYDVYVVGSDQIWRPMYYKDIRNAFLGFTKDWNVKRIAYAPSMAVGEWELSATDTEFCRQMLSCFDAVSVRERRSVNVIKDKLGIIPQCVLDPTMLLASEEYENICKQEDTKIEENSLFVYLLDQHDSSERIINKLCQEKNLKPVSIQYNHALTPDHIQESVQFWLKSIMDSNYVLTDSFHACVFSILFGKQFYVLQNEVRGNERINTLLNLFKKEDCLIKGESFSENASCALDDKNALSEYRNMSISFLKRAFK